jgi:hypothetical protein
MAILDALVVGGQSTSEAVALEGAQDSAIRALERLATNFQSRHMAAFY